MYFNHKLGRLFYEVFGVNNKKAIVLVHGLAMDHRTFVSQIESLKEKYLVIACDMPCHGKSFEISNNKSYSKVVASILVALLDYLRVEKAVFVGLSYGSIIIQKIAYNYPERVVALIAISGQSLYPKRTSLLVLVKYSFNLLIFFKSIKSLAKLFAKHKTTCSSVKKYLEEGVCSMGKKNYLYLTKELINDLIIGARKPINQPLLIIYGDKEFNAVKEMHKKWHKNTNNSVIAMVKESNHITNQDSPSEVNELIHRFLEVNSD